MTTIVKSKSKLSRKFGFPLWGNPKDAFHKREHPPGQHGVRMKRRASIFKKQLTAKQQLKAYCNLCERGFRKRFKDAEMCRDNTLDSFIKNLATKLDVLILHSSLISHSIFAIKQYISHGFILVNGKRVMSRGMNLKIGDVVSMSPKLFKIPHVKEYISISRESRFPEYLDVDENNYTITVVGYPNGAEDTFFPREINLNAIVEYYAR